MMKCWRCGDTMSPITDGNGQVVNQCRSCGRLSKPVRTIRVVPNKRADQSDSPYREDK